MNNIFNFESCVENMRARRHVFVFAGIKDLKCGYSMLIAQPREGQSTDAGFVVKNEELAVIKPQLKAGDMIRFVLGDEPRDGFRAMASPRYFKVIKNLEIVEQAPISNMWERQPIPN